MTKAISRIGVVVPAHDEADNLPACLAALQEAMDNVDVPVDIVVVLDSCTDASAHVCAAHGVRTRHISARNVGAARAAGVAEVLAGHQEREDIWLANTDADTVVPPGWLDQQLRLADDGADAVLGVVSVDAGTATRALAAEFELAYRTKLGADGGHRHVHGANFGIRASAYERAGGFPALEAHEDRELVGRLHLLDGVTILRLRSLSVRTSGRLVGRCAAGFAATLAATLAACDPCA